MVTASTGWLLSWVAADATARFEAALEAVGLTAHQLGVLSVLRAGPEKQARLSERLAVFKPVMVTLVNELEGLGYASRRPHPTDGRAVEVHLTDAGLAKLAQADDAIAAAEDAMFAPLDDLERRELHETLVRLTGVVE